MTEPRRYSSQVERSGYNGNAIRVVRKFYVPPRLRVHRFVQVSRYRGVVFNHDCSQCWQRFGVAADIFWLWFTSMSRLIDGGLHCSMGYPSQNHFRTISLTGRLRFEIHIIVTGVRSNHRLCKCGSIPDETEAVERSFKQPANKPAFLNRELENRLRSYVTTRCQILICYVPITIPILMCRRFFLEYWALSKSSNRKIVLRVLVICQESGSCLLYTSDAADE